MANTIVWTDLQARLAAADISAGGIILPIVWPNSGFKPPTGIAPWLLVEMAGGSSRPIELGGSIWQDEGQAFVHVLVPTNTGVAVAMGIVDQVVATFRSPPLEPVVYLRIYADPGGPGSDDGLYWRTSVTAEWRVQTYVARS